MPFSCDAEAGSSSVMSEPALAALLRVAVDASPVCISISDMKTPDAPLIFINKAFCDTTSYTIEEVLGRNCRFLQGEGTNRDTVAQMRAAIQRREAVCVEMINYKRSGEPFLNHLELAPVFNPALGIDAYVGVQHDITEFRAAEATRREREKMEALGRLASGISHELNNLLQPIMIYGKLLSSAPELRNSAFAEQLETIVDCAAAAGDVTAKVLRFARSGVATTHPEPISVRFGEAIRMASRLLPAGVSLSVIGIAELDGLCTADSADLLQVFGNLFRNASDAMNGSGRIRLSASVEGSDLVLSVSDTGPGIPAQIVSRIFEPFYSTKPPGHGTGLGLSTAYGIVSGWGGRIAVQNLVGGGAEFLLHVPLLQHATHAEHAATWHASS
jgi:PAS domain S-box-containing protein